MDPGFRLDDRYRLERRVARRGPAQVWAARDDLLARRVAVTLVGVRPSRRDLRQRLRDAARAAAALAHPNIVTTYDYGEAEGADGDALTYVVTEYLGGESLAARLTRGLPAPEEAVGLCAQLADALAAVHACGLVHGDLRPAQVFLTADGVKLLGLGVTGAIGGPDDLRDPPEPGGNGEPGGAEAPGGPRSPGDQAEDVLAFGRILTECLTGDPKGAPPPGGDGGPPADVADLAARCRAPLPGERPAAADVARVLAALMTDTASMPAVEAGPAAPRRTRWRGLGRTRRAVVLGGAATAVLALVLAPLGVIAMSLSDEPRGVALPPLPPSRSVAAPRTGPMGVPDADGRPRSPSGPAASAPARPSTREPDPSGSAGTAGPGGPAVPAEETRALTVNVLTRMRRAIDVGMAAGEVGPRFGTALAGQVTTLLNQVDAGEPVNLDRRVQRIRAIITGRRPGDASPRRAAALTALLDQVPVRT